MSEIHMGELLERVVRKKGLNITELARAVGVQRRTMYNWFATPQLSKAILQKIAKVIVYDFRQPDAKPSIVAPNIVAIATDLVTLDNDEYWKDKYIDLLERYSKILKNGPFKNVVDSTS
jgi:transcriptional regulator with XRE-family HTH domain